MVFLFVAAKNILQPGVEMDSQQQQFCLKWNSFGSNLATSFSNLFKSESLADVTLFCEGLYAFISFFFIFEVNTIYTFTKKEKVLIWPYIYIFVFINNK